MSSHPVLLVSLLILTKTGGASEGEWRAVNSLSEGNRTQPSERPIAAREEKALKSVAESLFVQRPLAARGESAVKSVSEGIFIQRHLANREDKAVKSVAEGFFVKRPLAGRDGKSVRSVAEGLFVRCYGRYGCFRTDGVWTR